MIILILQDALDGMGRDTQLWRDTLDARKNNSWLTGGSRFIN